MTTPHANPDASAANPAPPGPAAAGRSLKDSLNLPKTTFPMKANLLQNEPASLKRWSGEGTGGSLYHRLRQREETTPSSKGRFVFHDGPPYANGPIHIGHLMNKCLKDFVVRSRTMAGFDCPYVPGWDCHGLPIEHKVMTDLVEKGKYEKLRTLLDSQRHIAVRRECQAHAEKWVKAQSAQMQRLLTLADYDNPYLTMKPAFEGATLEVLASLLDSGLVFRALKPVHWSIANQTALAEAELEYEDRVDTSVYVDFEAADGDAVYDAFGLVDKDDADLDETDESDEAESEPVPGGAARSYAPKPGTRPGQRPCFMIWTTTPWTLPANLAIAVNPKFEYALVWVDGNVTVLAAALVEKVVTAAKAEEHVVLATTSGQRLLGLRYRHPFVNPTQGQGAVADPARGLTTEAMFSVVGAEYVTLEDGTGLVHTAPGHGAEDYATGLREKLPVYCPVLGDGTYDASVPEWLKGLDVWKANEAVVNHLRASGHLFYSHTFSHSYPHDWRSKTPTIFRCTEQWFVGVDRPGAGNDPGQHKSLRELALEFTAPGGPVNFVPEWGRNRMRGMLESRPDWCISRQRSWGLPIPALFMPDGSVFMTGDSVRAVAALVREKGSDAWFTASPEELLRHYNPAADAAAPAAIRDGSVKLASLHKGGDILDVWFESGSTWNAVMRERSGGVDFPMDLYLEGSDQHRGWFQTSLLPALGVMGRPPYRTLLTHGFVVDKDGRKMSKSLGNTLEVEETLKTFGADVCRWWVASLAYENDVKADKSYLEVAGESYRKIRNTLRFMLSNLYDFEPSGAGDTSHSVDVGRMPGSSLDAWVLAEFEVLSREVTAAYERYEFRVAQARLYDFCNDTLSAKYLAAVKDRLYCDKPDSPRRRRTQTVLWDLTDGLCRLLAPILVHTADEAYRSLWKAEATPDRCVHMERFVGAFQAKADAHWPELLALREQVLGAMEVARKSTGIDSPLEMGVVLPDPGGWLRNFDPTDLADLLGVSRVQIESSAAHARVLDLRPEPRCERSWKRDGTVKSRTAAGGALLCDRCAAAIGV